MDFCRKNGQKFQKKAQEENFKLTEKFLMFPLIEEKYRKLLKGARQSK